MNTFFPVVLALAASLGAAHDLDDHLMAALSRAGFTGTVGSSIEARLGRPIDKKLANLGRLLFFDKIASLHSDNACAGCHSPSAGFGDTQSIAIGIQNTSPLRNVALQKAFFHNGSFTRLEDAISHHLNVFDSARNYNPIRAGVDRDLTLRMGPIRPLLARIDPLLTHPIKLTPDEFESLVAFVRNGLLDPRAERLNLCSLIPGSLPSGMPPLRFEECPKP